MVLTATMLDACKKKFMSKYVCLQKASLGLLEESLATKGLFFLKILSLKDIALFP